MSALHAAGPWRNEYPIIYAASGAELLHIDEYDCATVYDTRLIAAAPDLLEALRRLLNDADEFLTLQGRRKLAHDAIAKATGVTP